VKGGKNMVDQGIVQVSMDNELKKQAEEIFDKIGIDMSTAVRMFFKATVRERQLPINTKVDDKDTEESFVKQTEKQIKYRPLNKLLVDDCIYRSDCHACTELLSTVAADCPRALPGKM